MECIICGSGGGGGVQKSQNVVIVNLGAAAPRGCDREAGGTVFEQRGTIVSSFWQHSISRDHCPDWCYFF